MSLICPLCQSPLQSQGAQLCCSNRHSFDRARQGYYHLLPVQHKKSLDPGDNGPMVEARRRFLGAGHYAPLAAKLSELAAQRAPSSWLDIGCGEGYYSAALAQALPKAQGYALDISKEAVKRACKLAPQCTWLVASMAKIPLHSASLELITSIFSPIDWQEAARLLPLGGRILRLGPAQDHLLELRRRLYKQVRDYQDDKHLTDLPASLALTHSEQLSFTLPLPERAMREDLLAMTPHGWRVNVERREQVLAEPFEVTVAVRYDWLEKIKD